jgi:hypothetical protein
MSILFNVSAFHVFCFHEVSQPSYEAVMSTMFKLQRRKLTITTRKLQRYQEQDTHPDHLASVPAFLALNHLGILEQLLYMF